MIDRTVALISLFLAIGCGPSLKPSEHPAAISSVFRNTNQENPTIVEQPVSRPMSDQSADIAKSDLSPVTLPANLIVSPKPSSRRPRHALVIGNSAYTSQELKNPVNDANDLAASLNRLKFDVTLELNVSHEKMEGAIRSFGRKLNKNSVGLFYYAGHAIQHDGTNYLIPVDAMERVREPEDLKYKTVDAGYVLDMMGKAGNGLNIVILDACRDSPFQGFTRSLTRGLAQLPEANGALIAFSTSPGNTAEDGTGRNSPYTKHLLRYITKPGLTIEAMFKNVMREVKAETGDRQRPWYNTSMEYDFYFAE